MTTDDPQGIVQRERLRIAVAHLREVAKGLESYIPPRGSTVTELKTSTPDVVLDHLLAAVLAVQEALQPYIEGQRIWPGHAHYFGGAA